MIRSSEHVKISFAKPPTVCPTLVTISWASLLTTGPTKPGTTLPTTLPTTSGTTLSTTSRTFWKESALGADTPFSSMRTRSKRLANAATSLRSSSGSAPGARATSSTNLPPGVLSDPKIGRGQLGRVGVVGETGSRLLMGAEMLCFAFPATRYTFREKVSSSWSMAPARKAATAASPPLWCVSPVSISWRWCNASACAIGLMASQTPTPTATKRWPRGTGTK
mmetsp:Transcript_37079/g.112059  ORF Transcript_37079/g.112059 Transcript_37079/m.112059 type:complete len:222 (-) Transcript_37079:64-729(-)